MPRGDLIGRCCDIASESIDGSESIDVIALDLKEKNTKRKLPVSNPELAQHFLHFFDKNGVDEFKGIKKGMCPKMTMRGSGVSCKRTTTIW